MKGTWFWMVAFLMGTGCGEERPRDRTASCSVSEEQDGRIVVSCPDGTSAILSEDLGSVDQPSYDLETVWEGDFMVSDDVEIVELQAYSTITGQLWVQDLQADVLFAPNLRRVGYLRVTGSTLRSIVLPRLADAWTMMLADCPNLAELHLPSLRSRLTGGGYFSHVPNVSACEAARLTDELCADGSAGVEPATTGCNLDTTRCSVDPAQTVCAEPCTLTCGEDGSDEWSCPADDEGVGDAEPDPAPSE